MLSALNSINILDIKIRHSKENILINAFPKALGVLHKRGILRQGEIRKK